MILMRRILLASLVLMSAACCKAQLVINEVMQSNVECLMDDINEFPDSWVELYNAGTDAVNLSLYKIGITDAVSEAWQLPSQTVASHQYVVIYCDKESNGRHTDFRLDSGKNGAVYLFQNGTLSDSYTKIPKMLAPDISYGLEKDGTGKPNFMLTATPGSPNHGGVSADILPEPIFSFTGSVLSQSAARQLTLSLPAGVPEGTVIRYTLNGTTPTLASPLYSSPLSITKNTVVRARLFCSGWQSPTATTHSYLILGRDVTLPVVSIVTADKYFNDNRVGIYVDGTYNSSKKNYEYDWRRPINIEFFENAGSQSVINQLCETRVQGGATRSNQLKSLAVYANKRFGTKRFSYEFFPDQRPGMTEYKSFLLRNAGNDFDYLYMRDAIIQRAMASHCDLDWQAWRPAIVFINGTYKGMLNIRERSNEDNIYTNYDGLEDIDMLENWNDLKTGTKDNWTAFQTFYTEHGHTYDEYNKLMDCTEFINMFIMDMYFNNQDWPGNNICMWRPTEEGGRWRFVAKDTDFGLGLYNSSYAYKTIQWLYNPSYDSNRAWANTYDATRLFRRLMEDADFYREFIDRTCIYMGDFLNEKGVRAVWDPMYEQIRTEYPYHRKLINEWWPNYSSELSQAQRWLKNRTADYYTQLGNYYSLNSPIVMKINADAQASALAGVDIQFNGVTLSSGVFDGKFFAGRKITLKGSPKADVHDGVMPYNVDKWTVTLQTSTGKTVTDYPGNTLEITMPSCYSMVVEANLAVADGISEVVDDDDEMSASRAGYAGAYNLQGMRLSDEVQRSHRGIIIRNGRKIVR